MCQDQKSPFLRLIQITEIWVRITGEEETEIVESMKIRVYSNGQNLSEINKSVGAQEGLGERTSEVDAKTEWQCVTKKNCNYWS